MVLIGLGEVDDVGRLAREVSYGDEPYVKEKRSLPRLSTTKVSLLQRACYRNYGQTREELERDVVGGSLSLSGVDDRWHVQQNKKLLATQEPAVPAAIDWTVLRVAEWIRTLGYPQYMLCFKQNFVNGRKLIHFTELGSFPKIGINDFLHMKEISKCVRDLLGVKAPARRQYKDYVAGRSIAAPKEDVYTMYLKEVARRQPGKNDMTYKKYENWYRQVHDRAWDLLDGKRENGVSIKRSNVPK